MLVTTEENPVLASGSAPGLAPGKPAAQATDPARALLAELQQGQRVWLWLAGLCSVGGLLGVAALYGGLSLLISAAADASTDFPPGWVWALMAGGIALRWATHLGRDWAGQTLSARARLALRMRLLHQATERGPAYLHKLGNTGWWVQRHVEQVDALHGYLARHLPARQTAVLVPLLIVVVVLWLDWLAGLLLLLALPLIPLFMALIGMGTQTVQEAQQNQQAQLAAELLQRMESLPLLRRVGALASSAQAVATAANGYRVLAMRVLRVAFLSSATLELFSALAIGLVAIYIGFALLGMVTFGPAADLTLLRGLFILMLAPECFLPLRQLAQTHHDLTGARAAAETLAPLLGPPVAPLPASDSTAQPYSKPAAESCSHTSPALAFRGVDFSYEAGGSGATPLLFQHLSFTLQAGECVGLAGPSGSGKSTVLALAAGFLQPNRGHVERMAKWAWLPQRVHLFHGTLRENLLLACPAAVDDTDLLQALEQAGFPLPHPDLPRGLDTHIGDLTSGLSGGQAQRVGLARALLSGAPLWLLDEPTAALDAPTRDRLLDTTFQAASSIGAAILVASHDPEVLARCSRTLDLNPHGCSV